MLVMGISEAEQYKIEWQHCLEENRALHSQVRDEIEVRNSIARAHDALEVALKQAQARITALEAMNRDWWCEACQKRYCGGPAENCSRAVCPECQCFMVNFWEHRNEQLRQRITQLENELKQRGPA